MASEVEPAKLLLPYLQRADELQKHEPLVAYYCRVYAMERGLKIPVKERTKTTNALLVSLMNQLEKDKKSLTLGQEDNLYVEGFALNVFGKADKQDRAGRADLNTAKTFYAASIFFEILHQFGEIQPDIEQKQKYSVWKAADIRKAISEGRKPLPGPPGGDELSVGSEAALDPQISPEQKNVKVSQEKPPAGQPADSGLRIPRAGMDAWQGSTQPLQPDDHYHDSDDIDLPSIPQQPLKSQDHSISGYPSLYSGTYYTPSSRPDAPDVSSTLPSYQYGSLVNGSDGQPQHPGYHSYAPTSPDGQIGSNVVPSAHLFHHAEHASSDTSYIQSPGAHVPTTPYAVNPTSTYTAPEYVSYFPGQSGIMGYGDSSLLPRTASAPAAPELSAVSSVKGTTSGFYQPPPEKIAEAHKASRFAVSALAFDDVPTAIAYLKQSLELLTNPSAPVH